LFIPTAIYGFRNYVAIFFAMRDVIVLMKKPHHSPPQEEGEKFPLFGRGLGAGLLSYFI
jgi:hypothetical protein